MEFQFEVVEYKFGEKFEIINHGVFQNMIDAWYCKKKMQESNGGDGSIFTVNVIVTNNIDQEFRNV